MRRASVSDGGARPSVRDSLAQALPIAHYWATASRRLEWANPAMARLYGFADGEALLGAAASELCLDEANRAWWQGGTGGPGARELAQRRQDGSRIWVRETVELLTGAHGQPLGYRGFLEDITRQKALGEALQELESRLPLREGQNRILEMIAQNAPLVSILTRLCALMESQGDGMLCSILLLDDDGVHVRHGAATSLPESYTRGIDGRAIGPRAGSCGTAMHRHQAVVVTDIERDPLWEDYRELAAAHGLRACWSTPIFSHQGHVLGSFALYYTEPRGPREPERRLVEIGARLAAIAIEHWRAEEALRTSQEKYRSFFEQDLAANYVAAPDGRLRACNRAFARMTGFPTPEAALPVNLWSYYPGPDARDAFLRALRGQGRLEDYPHELRTRDGAVLRVAENAVGRFDERGELVEIHGFVIDQTERRRTEEQQRQGQKMEAIGRLAGGVAHDFNNLLGVITGYSALLKKELEPSHPGLARIEQIRRAAERAMELTRQLLAFGRKQLMEPRVLDVGAVVADVERMLRRLIGENIHLVTAVPEGLGRVRADPGQIEQVLLNLAVNARDAMPQGGRLIIEASEIHLDDRFLRAHAGARRGPHVVVSVSDTGQGMSAEVLAHVFEPFFTTKELGQGTGLGLSIVDGIIRQSGGFIDAYSEPGHGSTFRVYLPRVEEAAEPRPQPPAAEGPALRGSGTVLLVEDDGALRPLIREMLEGAGYRVLDCNGPEEAVEAARAEPPPIGLLLTDVIMPRMSGPDLARLIRRLHPEIRTLYMSGYPDEAISQHGVLAPGTDFIAKPFTAEAVLRRMRQVLERP
jgi:PAS domain S-box-containing protein